MVDHNLEEKQIPVHTDHTSEGSIPEKIDGKHEETAHEAAVRGTLATDK